MTAPPPIACEVHDHLEVACLFRYRLEVVRQDGAVVKGRAITTRTLPDKTECLVLDTDGGELDVPMHCIDTVRVLTPGARFSVLKIDTAQDG